MRKNALILVLCIAVVVMAFVALQQNRQVRKMRQSNASGETAVKQTADVSVAVADKASQGSSNQKDQHVVEERRRLEKEIHQLKAQLEDVQTEIEDSTSEPAIDDDDPPQSPGKSPMAGYVEMMKNPAMKDMIRSQQKIALDMSYGSLFSEMELPPDELNKFKELLVDKQMAFIDMSPGMMGPGSADEMKERSRTIKAITEEYNDKVRLAIGEQYYEMYREYKDTLPDRMQVNQFKQLLATSNPLDEEQEQDLINGMYEERTQFFSSVAGDEEQALDPSRITEEDISKKIAQLAQLHENYVELARDILSESQLEQFTKSTEQMRAMQEMGIRISMQMLTKPTEEDDSDKTME